MVRKNLFIGFGWCLKILCQVTTSHCRVSQAVTEVATRNSPEFLSQSMTQKSGSSKIPFGRGDYAILKQIPGSSRPSCSEVLGLVEVFDIHSTSLALAFDTDASDLSEFFLVWCTILVLAHFFINVTSCEVV